MPELRARLRAELIVVNGENASHGFGLAPDMAQAMLKAGADVITLGNHAWIGGRSCPTSRRSRG